MVTAERPVAAQPEPTPNLYSLEDGEPEDILADYLPGILRNDPFLANFLRIFDSLLRPLLQQLDAVDHYFDPMLTPPELLPWLEKWIGAETLRTWPEPARRSLVKEAAVLHRTRGTRACLKRALELVTGRTVLVIENSNGLRLDGDGELGINTTLEPLETNTIYIVIRGGGDVDLRSVTEVVQRLKPAHAAFSIRIADE
jgi:phage tail-like protein